MSLKEDQLKNSEIYNIHLLLFKDKDFKIFWEDLFSEILRMLKFYDDDL